MNGLIKIAQKDIISLSKIATKLDSLGFTKEADVIDILIKTADLEMMSQDYSNLRGDVQDFIRESERVLPPDTFEAFQSLLDEALQSGTNPDINILMHLVEEAKSHQ